MDNKKLHLFGKDKEDYKIIEMGQQADYRKSAVWSMWDKSYFL